MHQKHTKELPDQRATARLFTQHAARVLAAGFTSTAPVCDKTHNQIACRKVLDANMEKYRSMRRTSRPHPPAGSHNVRSSSKAAARLLCWQLQAASTHLYVVHQCPVVRATHISTISYCTQHLTEHSTAQHSKRAAFKVLAAPKCSAALRLTACRPAGLSRGELRLHLQFDDGHTHPSGLRRMMLPVRNMCAHTADQNRLLSPSLMHQCYVTVTLLRHPHAPRCSSC
jgi:hypothetical protein